MEIQIEPHTLQRAKERGAAEEEIIITINDGYPIKANIGRLGKTKTFTFNKEWNKRIYKEKKLEVYFVIENDVIITVTVYVFFGNFGNNLKDLNLMDLVT